MKFPNIDLFKGALIISVIAGHVWQGTLEDSLARTLIYSFHMPLFIGISGFLFNARSAVDYTLPALLGKYFFRVIVPWSLAVVIYGGLVGRAGFWSAAGIVKSFLFPYYHLWFIPAFLGWIILTWILLKLKIRNSWLLLISFLVSVGFYAIDKVPGWYMENGHARAILQFVLATLRPYYFFFFVLGLFLRKTLLPKPSFIEYFICALLFGVIVHLFFARNPLLYFIIFFLLNTVLLTLILKISVKNLAGRNSLLEWIGVIQWGFIYGI